jgi:hypothetical protein
MIIIKSKGGLGNQMFQYAFGRALSLKRNTDLALDIAEETTLKGIKRDTNRAYTLYHFDIKARIAAPEDIRTSRKPLSLYLSKVWRKISKYNYYAFNPRLLEKKDGAYFEGFWWQSEKYFKDIRQTLLQDFTLKEGLGTEAEKVAESIRHTESPVALHVRRGDYANDPATLAVHGLAPREYYREALQLITEKSPHPVFYVFSDDIEWAKENLSFPYPVLFVSEKNIPDYEELVLMSLCKHHIIANSSFSWWGAWLGTDPEQVVIAPKQWIADPSLNTEDLYPEGWIKI